MAFRGEPIFALVFARLPFRRVRTPGGGGLPRGKRAGGRGQGLVEFAISLPVVLLMVLFGVDFGRVFVGWISLTNAVREAANFAALNPTAWTAPGNPAVVTEYNRLITAEAANVSCTLPATLPDPTFPNGTDIGSPAVVAITCEFSLITPVISNILGSPIPVSASSSFPVRSGVINGTPAGGGLPTPGPTAVPTPTQSPTPSPAPTPIPMCTVPNFKNSSTNAATSTWTTAGFTANNLAFSPLVPPAYTIKSQTLTKNSSVPCTSSMTVSNP
jgi:hypothetical protein